MSVSKQWTVAISIDEEPEDRATTARARLRCDDGYDLTGHGSAARFPKDPELPTVGDDLAAARALDDLARQLKSSAYTTITEMEGPSWDNW